MWRTILIFAAAIVVACDINEAPGDSNPWCPWSDDE